MPKQFIAFLIFGFIVGVASHSMFFDMSINKTMIVLVCLCAVFVVFFSKRKKVQFFILLSCLGFILGMWRFHTSLNHYQERQQLSISEEIEQELVGIVGSEVEQRRQSSRFVFQTIIDNQDYSFLVYTEPFFNAHYGDQVIVTGILKLPKNFETEQGRIFDYKNYLAKDGISHIISFADVSLVGISKDLSSHQRTIRYLYKVKDSLVSNINQRFAQPESGLLAGILLGKKDALSEEVTEQFRRVGLMHIVVLSGYNVSLVIQLMMDVLYFLPLRFRSLLAVLGIISFALLVGAGPTVVRASIMALFIVLAKIVGRKYHVERGLIIAGIIMILINPWVLIFDISFQLSFIATYGLITISPLFEYWLRWIPEFLEFRKSAVATLSAQIAVTPLLLYAIGDLSIISPLVNIIVLFAVPWAMLFGFITSLSFVPEFFSIFAYLPLRYITWVVEQLSRLPFAVATIPRFHIAFMLLMYVAIFWWLHVSKRILLKREQEAVVL